MKNQNFYLLSFLLLIAFTSCHKDLSTHDVDEIQKYAGVYEFEVEKEIDGILHAKSTIGRVKIIDKHTMELILGRIEGITKCRYILNYDPENGFTMERHEEAVINIYNKIIDFEIDNTIFTGTYCCN